MCIYVEMPFWCSSSNNIIEWAKYISNTLIYILGAWKVTAMTRTLAHFYHCVFIQYMLYMSKCQFDVHVGPAKNGARKRQRKCSCESSRRLWTYHRWSKGDVIAKNQNGKAFFDNLDDMKQYLPLSSATSKDGIPSQFGRVGKSM